MITVEFRLTISESRGDYIHLAEHYMPQVPGVASLVNIDGNPYRVNRVTWSVSSDDPDTYAYAYMDKAGCFTLTSGGREY